MKLKNFLLVVRDIDTSKAFYHRIYQQMYGGDWGRRMIRIYDPNGHVIEVSEVKG